MNEPNKNSASSYQRDFLNLLRGFFMGAADTVPGVSGGTVALIMGHYARLVRAISHVDHHLIKLLRGRRWIEAFHHLDGRFLLMLAIGIATGIVLLANAMHFLLDVYLPETFSVFLGLLVASVWVVVRSVEKWTSSSSCVLALGILIAYGISMLPSTSGDPSLPYLFLAASVAICAMILPGVSGAFVLLIFGVYHPITGTIKEFAKFNFSTDGFLQITVVACGCLFGLLAFSHLLRFLLDKHPSVTLSGLTGLMIGSAFKLWPLQMATSETASLPLKSRVMQHYSPANWEGTHCWILLALGSVAAVLVITTELWTERLKERKQQS
ncbi:MAG: DUF368 domain-containing protein [Rubripirellula sp.]